MTDTQLTVGDPAPGFTLKSQHGEDVALSSWQGRRSVLVVFYPFAFSGLCTGELSAVQDDLTTYQNDAVQVVAVSCDPVYTLRAWADAEGLTFPLLSDFWPHGEVARSYGVFEAEAGFAVRGTFLVDTEWVLRWKVVNGPGEIRDPATYRAALAAL
jgi:mycoredoxin-dependent peroxiredoxin